MSHTSIASTNIATEPRLVKSRCDSTISSHTSETLPRDTHKFSSNFLFIADVHLLTGCMALQIVRSVLIVVCKGQLARVVWHYRLFAVCKGQLLFRRGSPSILKKTEPPEPAILNLSPFIVKICAMIVVLMDSRIAQGIWCEICD